MSHPAFRATAGPKQKLSPLTQHQANGVARHAPAVNEAEDDPHRLARLYLDDHQAAGARTLHFWRGEWYRWDGRAYCKVPPEELRAQLSARIKREFDDLNAEAVAAWEREGAPDGQKPKPRPVARRVTVRLVGDTLQALTGLAILASAVEPPAWLEADKPAPSVPASELLVCHNRVVHVPAAAKGEGGTLPLTPRLFTMNSLDYDHRANPPTPREWLAFLAKIWPDDPESVSALQEWAGYCLLPDTRQQKILMVVGPKRSGKGTIARVLRALVGAGNTAAPTLAGLGTNFGLSPLLGKTLAIISDARLSSRTDAAAVVERLLSISGEDAQTVDRKNLAHVTVRLPVRFVILTNELPRLNDPSGALVGRLIVLRQTQSWYGQEDTTLTDRLLRELPGILRWAMDGWARLAARGRFLQPASGLKLVTELENLSSPIGAFLRERCQLGQGYEVEYGELYQEWKRWCEENGRKEAGTTHAFGRDLRAAVPAIDDRQHRIGGSRMRFYVGIRCRQEDPDDEV